MSTRSTLFNRHPMSHISVADSIQQQQALLQANPEALEDLDRFYQGMLKEFDPAEQKRRYQQQLDKQISSLYRHDGVLVALRFVDGSLDCFDPLVAELIGRSELKAPCSNAQLVAVLAPVLGSRLSIESYSGGEPTYADLKLGYLYNSADLEAGFRADHVSLEEHMCDWIQLYQRWLHDYLAFNLAQVSRDSHAENLPPAPLERLTAPETLLAI